MKHLNKYQIRERLGGGATADVYLAYDPFLQVNVALKVIKPDILRDPDNGKRVRHMFMNEARLVRELQHPNIMAILDAVYDDESAYLVLEFVDGKPLSNYIAPDTLLPVATVLQVAFKCCMAMEYASGLGWGVEEALANFDTTPLLRAVGATIETGPTGNNLRDLRMLLFG